MNIFIIEIPEEYDMYEVMMPYPYITSASKESVEKYISDYADAVVDYENLKRSSRSYIKLPEFKIGKAYINSHSVYTRKYDGQKSIFAPAPENVKVSNLLDWLIENNTRLDEEWPILNEILVYDGRPPMKED